LRETFTKVFADMGDALRDRMREIASNLNVAAPGTAATPQAEPTSADSGTAKSESEN
jgi:hypothetical protein